MEFCLCSENNGFRDAFFGIKKRADNHSFFCSFWTSNI
jgi:hypothetical protein